MDGAIVTPRPERVLARLDELFALGGGRGANRLAYTREEERALELAAGWMEEAGLAVERDAIGNLFGRLEGSRPGEVWTGSHLDSVPEGGRYDGALGVVAALEAVERIGAGGPPARTLAVVVFRDEEGARFGRGFSGSRALCGRLEEGELEARDAEGTTMRDALAALGLHAPPARGWLGRGPDAYVEAHVEQGPVLDALEAPLAVVTGIAAIARGTAVFRGSPGHAGTTPMRARADALCAAAEFVLAAREAAAAIEGAVATVGRISADPGAVNVIPGRATLSVDARAPDDERHRELLASLREAAGARRGEVELAVSRAVALAPEPTAALREAISELGLPLVELPSGAGHDAGVLAAAGVPAGMLFVRSRSGGLSHAPEEATAEEDVALCVAALEGALRRLAGG